jgi:hypothetical protein
MLVWGFAGAGRRAVWGVGLRLGYWGRGFDICLCVSMLCCPVYIEVFATGWSLIQRSPAEYPNKITKPPLWGGQGPYTDCWATDDDDDDDDDERKVLTKLRFYRFGKYFSEASNYDEFPLCTVLRGRCGTIGRMKFMGMHNT